MARKVQNYLPDYDALYNQTGRAPIQFGPTSGTTPRDPAMGATSMPQTGGKKKDKYATQEQVDSGFGGLYAKWGLNPSDMIGNAHKVITDDPTVGQQWRVQDANRRSIDTQLGNLGQTLPGIADLFPQLGSATGQFANEQDAMARQGLLQSIMGERFDPNQSLGQNMAAYDRQVNPELYGAAANIAGQQGAGLTGVAQPQAPGLTEQTWADHYANQLSNEPRTYTSTWNRFDQGADRLRNEGLPDYASYNRFDEAADAMRNQALPQLQTQTGANPLEYKNWATDTINDLVWNATGVNHATADKNQIFNYSPEAERARELIGRRLSDGGGENLGSAYSKARTLNEQGTDVGAETTARDKLLTDMSRMNNIGAGNVNLQVDDVGAVSQRELRDAEQAARAGWNDRGRARDTGAVLDEVMASEDARRARRAERNQNFLNQANVDLQNQQNSLQGQVAGGSQNLQRMNLADQILGNRFNQRMAADDSQNRRMMESIGALSGTDAQRFANFRAGVRDNMAFDQDWQNRVDRYADLEMRQNQFNTDQTNNWINQLAGVDDRYQGVQQYNNDLAMQQAMFGNQAAMQQDALRAGRLGEYERANQDWMQRQGMWDDARARRLNEQMVASDNWNNRQLQDDALRRQRMQDYQNIASDWRGREQQDFANQLGNYDRTISNTQQDFLNQLRLNQNAYDAYNQLRQDPFGQLMGVQGGRIDPGSLFNTAHAMGERDHFGFTDSMNLNNNIMNALMGYNSADQANRQNEKNAWISGLIGGAGALGGAIIACWWARGVYGDDNPKWLVFRDWLLNKAPKAFRDWYFETGPKYAADVTKDPKVRAVLRPFMDMIIDQHIADTLQQEVA